MRKVTHGRENTQQAIIEYFILSIQKLSLLLRRENDASFPRFFIELSVSVLSCYEISTISIRGIINY